MVSLGLLNLVSDAYLVKPDKSTSSSGGNGVAQLNSTLNKLSSGFQSQASTATVSSSSSRLADDTYTPSSQGSQGDTVTLANLVKNQTISGSSEVRQVLLAAIAPYNTAYFDVKNAWDAIGTKVATGDYSGAQTELTDYTTALSSLHYDTSLIAKPVDALESALQTGNNSDVQAAFTAFTSNTPEGILSVGNLGYSGPGDAKDYAGRSQMVAPALTDQLEKIGYTASNATAEANAILLGIMVDDATITVNSASTTDLSSQVDQSITDLAKAAAQSTDKNMLSNIIAGMAQANSVTAMESTLTQLDSKYGSNTQGAVSDNAGQASVSVYA